MGRRTTGNLYALDQSDLDFLSNLSRIMQEQPTFSQADPRFWVVREQRSVPCWEEQCEYYDIVDSSSEKVGTLDHPIPLGDEYTLVPMRDTFVNVENTMFLTLEDCEEHIKANSHHYNNPKPFAMTAWRSPQVEYLVALLKEVDWENLEVIK